MARGSRTYYEPGAWNVSCSMCGAKRKSFEVVKNWMGMYRCPEHNEPRHPQDFVSGVKDDMSVPFAQPPSSIFLNICSFDGMSAVPGIALPGCSLPGRATLSTVPTPFSADSTFITADSTIFRADMT